MWRRNPQPLLTSRSSPGVAVRGAQTTEGMGFCASDRQSYSQSQVSSRTQHSHRFNESSTSVITSAWQPLPLSSNHHRTGLSLFRQDFCVRNFNFKFPSCTPVIALKRQRWLWKIKGPCATLEESRGGGESISPFLLSTAERLSLDR